MPPLQRGSSASELEQEHEVFRLAVQSGDGEIRTLDPLLARQVLSQLSYTPIDPAPTCSPIRHPPVLPHRHQCSTFGRLGLNRRVRDGNGCDPQMYRHRKLITLSLSDDGQELIESLLSYEIMTGIIEGEAFMRNPKDSECAQGYFKPLDQRPDSTYNPYFFP